MKLFVVVCALFALTQGATLYGGRIVGGDKAKAGQFKYIASLRTEYNDRHFCGSTIIGKRTLATAAHCRVTAADEIIAVVGITDLKDAGAKRYHVKEFIIHADYDPSSITNDVAVVILDEDIEFNDFVQPLKLATKPIEDNQRLTSCGWGYTSYPGQTPNDLQWFKTKVLSHKDCTSLTGTSYLTGKICTLEEKGKGVCSGDSGGPLVNADQELVGITSAAYLCALGMPDFFTDVHHYKQWILDHADM